MRPCLARTVPVPVPVPVMDALQEHLVVYCAGAGREDFLFLTRTGSHPLRAKRDARGLHGRPAPDPTLNTPRCGLTAA